MLQTVNDAPRVRLATAPNPGPKTLEGTHTYVIGHDPAYIVDPGPLLPAYLDAVARELAETESRPAAILLTHGHPDHAGGAPHLASALDIPVFGSERIATAVAPGGMEVRRFPARAALLAGGVTIEVLDTPGHSEDHVAFWLPDSRILFSGDTVLGRGTTLVQPPEGDMTAYMRTLSRLLALQPRLLFPGHGPIVTDPAAKLREYIAHRERREREILEALEKGPLTATEMVHTLYADQPPALQELALGSVRAMLQKLIAEHRVGRDGDRFRCR